MRADAKQRRCDPIIQSLGSHGWVGACECGERVTYSKNDQELAQSWWQWHEVQRIMQSVEVAS